MKLSMFGIVERTMRVREQLLEQISAVEMGLANVQIRGVHQDDAMWAIVKPVILRELRGRLASIDRDLVRYGVDIDADKKG